MIELKPCPFCGNKVRVISYWQNFDCDNAEYVLEIECRRCGEFKLCHNTYFDGFKPRTAYDIWNSRVHDVDQHIIYGKDDADDWCE